MTTSDRSETLDAYDRFAAAYTARYFDTRALDEDLAAFLLRLPPRPLVLDAGCGPGHQAATLNRFGAEAVGLDLSHVMLVEGRRRVPGLRLVQGDLLALPFPTGAFHGVWARASLIHLTEDETRRALAGFRRVLRPGGALYVCVRVGEGDAVREETLMGVTLRRYFHFWTPHALAQAVGAAGFQLADAGDEDGEPENWTWLHAAAR